jgi:hypothetical protein
MIQNHQVPVPTLLPTINWEPELRSNHVCGTNPSQNEGHVNIICDLSQHRIAIHFFPAAQDRDTVLPRLVFFSQDYFSYSDYFQIPGILLAMSHDVCFFL